MPSSAAPIVVRDDDFGPRVVLRRTTPIGDGANASIVTSTHHDDGLVSLRWNVVDAEPVTDWEHT